MIENKENTGFEAYNLYMSLKLHFTSDSYDYFKYNGKTNVSKQTFTTRKDKYQFYKLSRKYSLDELRNFYVSNFLVDNNHWVGDLLTPQGEETYRKWQKVNQSLTYTFENDIIYLLDKYGVKGEELFRVDRGNFPKLLEEVMRENVHLETLILLNNNTGFLEQHWVPRIQDDIIWPEWLRKILKYTPFLYYDEKKIKQILKDKVKEYAD